jgi:hypothetical protein
MLAIELQNVEEMRKTEKGTGIVWNIRGPALQLFFNANRNR